jgi:hexulose-6-phosphate isomerase
LLAYSAAFGSAFLASQGLVAANEDQATPPPKRMPPHKGTPARKVEMKKSINMWAFPYPQRWTLQESLELAKDAGFDGVEINFLRRAGRFASQEIRGIGNWPGRSASPSAASFVSFWPYSMSHNAGAATEGSRTGQEDDRLHDCWRSITVVVPGRLCTLVENYDVCDQRAREAVRTLIPFAEKAGVSINIENIFMNGFLFSPQEMVAFVDSFRSKHVQIHFDTGNIMHYQFPEHWVPILGKRIKNIHFKEWDKRGQEFNLHTFRTLLDGTTNWPAVIAALDQIGYRGYLTFEYFHPFQHYPEALVYQASDALD